MSKTISRSMTGITAFILSMILGIVMLTAPVMAETSENTVTIGEGTNASCFLPYRNDWTYARTQIIYPANEIGRDGAIVSLAYNVATTSTHYNPSRLRIWMGHTERDKYPSDMSGRITESELTLTSNDVSLVYDGKPSIGKTTGWEKIMLDTSFEYKRSEGNLVIVTGVQNTHDGTYADDLTYYWTYTGNGADDSSNYVALVADSISDSGIADIAYSGDESWRRAKSARPIIQLGFGEGSGEATEKYAVTFDADGGSPVPETQNIEKGAKATRPTDPKKDGFTFAGWYSGDTLFDFDSEINAAVGLKAKWNKNTDPGGDDPAAVSKAALQKAISDAQDTQNGVIISADGSNVDPKSYFVTESDKNALNSAVEEARTILNKTDATQSEVDKASGDLNSAIAVYEKAKKPGIKGLPVITDIRIDKTSGRRQPASGGKYVWHITFNENCDLSKITDDHFQIQRKPHGEDWKNSKCPVPFFTPDRGTGAHGGLLEATAIPDNDAAGENQWRFTYAGVNNAPLDSFPIIIQATSNQKQGEIDPFKDDDQKDSEKKQDENPSSPVKDDQKPSADDSAADLSKQMGKDGTPTGEGASFAAADAAIVSSASDEGPAGTVFGRLQLRSVKQTGNTISLKWKKIPGAVRYAVYAGEKGNTFKAAGTLTGNSLKLARIDNKKLKKGRYYKAMVVAVDSNDRVITSSKAVFVSTKGSRTGNPAKVTTAIKKSRASLKQGRSLRLRAKQYAAKGKRVKKCRKLSYESSDPKVATVSGKGVIKGRSKGTCFVYAYAQNGVFARNKIVVK